ncbi:hypothetical protein D3C81_925580 [compost metagenome]
MDGGGFIGAQPQVGESHARAQRVAVVGRRIDRARPVAFHRFQANGVAVVQPGVVESAHLAGSVVGMHGFEEGLHRQTEQAGQLLKAIGGGARENRWHEAPEGFPVDDRKPHLPWLMRHQAPPDGIALGPEILAFIVEALAVAVDHHAQRHTIDARADAAVV